MDNWRNLIAKNLWRDFWQDFERRFSLFPSLVEHFAKYPTSKRWAGQSYSKLILICEQGLGDNLQFLRLAKLLPVKPFVLAYPPLAPLFEIQDYIQGTYTVKLPVDYDYWFPLLSLGSILNLAHCPSLPYIKADDAVKITSAKKKIGLCWCGNPAFAADINRSCPLSFFEPIMDLDAEYYSLVFDKRERGYKAGDEWVKRIDYSEHPDHWKITDLASYMFDWRATASMVSQMDCVVSVDTGVAHLAASMGIKTYLLLPYDSCWRWGSGFSQFWYPSMTLHRQQVAGDWASAVKSFSSSFLVKE